MPDKPLLTTIIYNRDSHRSNRRDQPLANRHHGTTSLVLCGIVLLVPTKFVVTHPVSLLLLHAGFGRFSRVGRDPNY
jgi:hypothetical protein